MTNLTKGAEEQRSIIFLHIPKAAGTTLYRIIDKQYEPKSIFTLDGFHPQESIAEFKTLPEASKREIKLIQGHMRFGIHEYLPQPFTYMTVLREPVERIISHYYFVRRTPRHYLYNEVTSKDMSLKDYVGSGISTELNNAQTRVLAGVESISFGQCSPEILETAKKNIQQHFAVVGLADKFEETLLLLKRVLGWKTPFYIRQNVTKDRPPKENISEDTLKIIEKYNELDIELYKYVQEMFEQTINQRENLSKMELERFKLLNGIYSKAYPYYRGVVNKVRALGALK